MQATGGVIQMGPGGNILIQGGEFTQHNHAPNVDNNNNGELLLCSHPRMS